MLLVLRAGSQGQDEEDVFFTSGGVLCIRREVKKTAKEAFYASCSSLATSIATPMRVSAQP